MLGTDWLAGPWSSAGGRPLGSEHVDTQSVEMHCPAIQEHTEAPLAEKRLVWEL